MRESAEGLILLDCVNESSGVAYDLLQAANEAIRWAAASCFVAHATAKIQAPNPHGDESGELSGVPSGQVRVRLTLRPEGSVANIRVVESGFEDKEMEACVVGAFRKQRFPQSTRAFTWQLDAFYWVSLGFHRSLDLPEFHLAVRKAVASQSVRAANCLRDRDLPAGTYEVDAMSLVNAQGESMANRAEVAAPVEVKRCLELVLRELTFMPEPDSFARPVFYRFPLIVQEGGIVDSPEGEWLRLLELEDAALREQAREAAQH